MTRVVVIGGNLAFLAFFGVAVCGRPALAFDWPKDLNATPSANRTDLATISALINGALNNNASTPVAVTEFRFVPLEIAGRIDLIASVDFSGRGLNSFVGVWRSSTGYDSAVLPSCGIKIARDVVDLDGAGVYEVLAGEIPGGYQGTATMPIPWYGLYALRRGKWINVSDHYAHFFPTDQALSLVLKLTDAFYSGDKDLVELYRANDLFVHFKYEQMIMHHKNAGLETALGWAESSSRSIRVLAVKTLCDSDDPRSALSLKKLSMGSDPAVAIQARDALAHRGACSP